MDGLHGGRGRELAHSGPAILARYMRCWLESSCHDRSFLGLGSSGLYHWGWDGLGGFGFGYG